MSKNSNQELAQLIPHTDIAPEAVKEIAGTLSTLLADVFALYVKTKNFHWHMSGPHFRDYHLLLDEQGEQLFAMTDDIAERARKIGGTTIRSVGHIARVKRIADNDAEYVTPKDMLSELWEDNKALILSMRSAHTLCDERGDVATTSILENWIDETNGAPGSSLRRHAVRTGPGPNTLYRSWRAPVVGDCWQRQRSKYGYVHWHHIANNSKRDRQSGRS